MFTSPSIRSNSVFSSIVISRCTSSLPCHHSSPWKSQLGVAVGVRRCVTDKLLVKADVIRSTRELVQLCQDPRKEFAILRESTGVSRINHILRVHGHTILHEEEAAKTFDEIGQRSLDRLSQVVPRTIQSKPSSVPENQGLVAKKKNPWTSPVQHTSEQSLQTNGAATAGLLPEQPLFARLDAFVEASSAAFLGALEDSENRTATLHLQKAAKLADEAWRQTAQGHNGLTITSPTIPDVAQTGLASKHDDDDFEPTVSCPTPKRTAQRFTAPSTTFPIVR